MLDVIFVFDFVLAAPLLIAKFIFYRQEFAFFPVSDLYSGYQGILKDSSLGNKSFTVGM